MQTGNWKRVSAMWKICNDCMFVPNRTEHGQNTGACVSLYGQGCACACVRGNSLVYLYLRTSHIACNMCNLLWHELLLNLIHLMGSKWYESDPGIRFATFWRQINNVSKYHPVKYERHPITGITGITRMWNRNSYLCNKYRAFLCNATIYLARVS